MWCMWAQLTACGRRGPEQQWLDTACGISKAGWLHAALLPAMDQARGAALPQAVSTSEDTREFASAARARQGRRER